MKNNVGFRNRQPVVNDLKILNWFPSPEETLKTKKLKKTGSLPKMRHFQVYPPALYLYLFTPEYTCQWCEFCREPPRNTFKHLKVIVLHSNVLTQPYFYPGSKGCTQHERGLKSKKAGTVHSFSNAICHSFFTLKRDCF